MRWHQVVIIQLYDFEFTRSHLIEHQPCGIDPSSSPTSPCLRQSLSPRISSGIRCQQAGSSWASARVKPSRRREWRATPVMDVLCFSICFAKNLHQRDQTVSLTSPFQASMEIFEPLGLICQRADQQQRRPVKASGFWMASEGRLITMRILRIAWRSTGVLPAWRQRCGAVSSHLILEAS